jgi:hypothetical protein
MDQTFNLGPKINTDQTEMAASVSPDGKYLFFHRGHEYEGNMLLDSVQTYQGKNLC